MAPRARGSPAPLDARGAFPHETPTVTRLTLTLPLLSALTVAGVSVTASAAPVVDSENRVHRRFRFHVDTEALNWTHRRDFPAPAGEVGRTNTFGLGFARPLEGDKVPTGASIFGLGLGYGITPYLILGARLGLGFEHEGSPNDGDIKNTTNTFQTIFNPYLEILPLPRGRVLPFILVRTGFAGGAVGNRTSAPGGDGLNRVSFIAPTLGVGGGIHFLITDYFSLDASLMFDYRWYFSKTRQRVNDVTTTTGWDKAGTQSLTLAAVLGFSVWFGGGR